MNKSKRVARKIGIDEEEPDQDQPQVSFVKRPSTKAKRTTTAKVRAAYNNDDEEAGAAPSVVKPKKLGARRGIGEPSLPFKTATGKQDAGNADDDDPYSAANLAHMKSSMRAPPPRAGEEDPMVVDTADPQGTERKTSPAPAMALLRADEAGGSLIPTEAEIREKKERRRRLALEAQAEGAADDFIALDDPAAPRVRRASDASDIDPRTRSLIVRAEEYDGDSKWGETRLVHEDEDIAEGFDDFVEDSGRVTLGRRGMKKQEKDRKKEIELQIRTAQGGGDDGDIEMDEEIDEDEAERIRAYEASQTKAGSYGNKSSKQREKEREESLRKRLEVLPRMKTIPTMAELSTRYRNMVKEKQDVVAKTKEKIEELKRQEEELDKDEVRIKGLLNEAGERFERLRADAMYPKASADGAPDPGRGLESLGSATAPVPGDGVSPSGMGGRPPDDYD